MNFLNINRLFKNPGFVFNVNKNGSLRFHLNIPTVGLQNKTYLNLNNYYKENDNYSMTLCIVRILGKNNFEPVYTDSYISTIGVDFKIITIELDGKVIKVYFCSFFFQMFVVIFL
jgi:hypothetical protein